MTDLHTFLASSWAKQVTSLSHPTPSLPWSDHSIPDRDMYSGGTRDALFQICDEDPRDCSSSHQDEGEETLPQLT
jgi:hypothetical protein